MRLIQRFGAVGRQELNTTKTGMNTSAENVPKRLEAERINERKVMIAHMCVITQRDLSSLIVMMRKFLSQEMSTKGSQENSEM